MPSVPAFNSFIAFIRLLQCHLHTLGVSGSIPLVPTRFTVRPFVPAIQHRRLQLLVRAHHMFIMGISSYSALAHFHYVMVGGMVSGFMAGLHFWWPKITGRMYPETMGRLAAVILFMGFSLTFFPQFILGYLGMPGATGHILRNSRF